MEDEVEQEVGSKQGRVRRGGERKEREGCTKADPDAK
jgi:hypothetical protein